MGSGLGIVRCGKGSYSPEDLHLYESLSSNLRHTSSVSTASKGKPNTKLEKKYYCLVFY